MSVTGRGLSSKLILSAMFCAFALCLPEGAFAACVNDPDTAQKAAAFTTNPSSLLEGPNGPRNPDDVAADVQTFVASYPQALPAVLAILKDLENKGPSSSALQKAIGTGLGKAANVCKTTDLTFSLEIQGDLGAAGSADANAQYAAFLDSPSQKATGIPVTEASLDGSKFVMKVAAVGAEYRAELNGNTLMGQWAQGPMTHPLTLTKK